MAVALDTYLFYDAGNGANVTEAGWRSAMRHMLGSAAGVIRGFTNECEVYGDSSGMQVKVRTGECWIRGQYGALTSEKTLGIAAAHATLARKDRVVVRNDFVNNRIEVDVLTGTAAASPSAPAVTQNTAMWETSLAIVDIPAADTSIGSSQVTDDRVYTSVQGKYVGGAQNIVTYTYQKIDYTTVISRSGDIQADLTNNQFTLLRPGLWTISATFRYAGVAGGKRELIIADPADVSGGVASDILAGQTDGGHSAEIHLACTTTERFPAGQIVTAFTYQDTGATRAAAPNGNSIGISIVWVGP